MTAEHFDVLIVGAGLSGIGAGVHLQRQCPTKSYVILEGRGTFGGTWDLFRYPGIRSDSDMHTLGYAFKPWTDAKAIADGPAILKYVGETAAEHGVDRHIRYGHRVVRAAWSTTDARWTVEAEAGGGVRRFTCSMLFMCAGYYSYERGYRPAFEGLETFKGVIADPQAWPAELDYVGKRVLVIGSGATAMTIVPAMSGVAAHVVMVQRSPTYVISRPAKDAIANALRKVLPAGLAYRLTRWKNIALQQFLYRKTRTEPKETKAKLLHLVRKGLPPGYDVETHFTPRYDPWDQRMCLIPDGDLYEAITAGKASVVTDHIDRFTPDGLKLKSGAVLPADIVVIATGLELTLMGGVELAVDGQRVDLARTWTYKGMMFSGVPNLVSTFGYINASWTLRSDLTAEYVCRLVNHLDATGTRQATPRLRPGEEDMPARPWIEGFSSGYMQRGLPRYPRQGDREPWVNPQNYALDRKMIRTAPLEDGALVFDNPAPARAAEPVLQAAE